MRVPILFCPIEPAINQYVQIAKEHTDNWVTQYSLHTGNDFLKYQGDNFAYMTARFYPFCSADNLCLANDLNTALFVMDDAMDNQREKTELVQSTGNYLAFYERVMRILDSHYQDNEGGETGIFAALTDLWNRLSDISSIEWQKSFAADIRKMFDAGLWELKNVQNGTLPSENDFYTKRQFLGAAHISTALIPVINNLDLPENILQHQSVQTLTELAQRIVCWANDLFSYSKEAIHGDQHNMIEVIMNNSKVTFDQAVHRTVVIHDQDMQKFTRIASELPPFPGYDSQLQQYVRVLGAILKGNIDWSVNETKRYNFIYGA